jgi:NDP-sugar pyrophosphorylase family protein
MKAAIIAAGKGERMARGGINVPKPLVLLDGEPLIARAIRTAAGVGASSVACIANEIHPEVSQFLRSQTWPVPLELVVKTTPSSMESLFQLSHLLSDEPFLMLTVDAVFASGILDKFLSEAQSISKARGVLALTRYVDDEKPLWAGIDCRHRICALGDAAEPTPYVTAGFYYFDPEIFSIIETARRNRLQALRQFLGLLLEKGYPIYGVPVSKTIDVDCPDDLRTAEDYLKEKNSEFRSHESGVRGQKKLNAKKN